MNITVGSPSGSQGAVEWVVRLLFAWSCLVLVGSVGWWRSVVRGVAGGGSSLDVG